MALYYSNDPGGSGFAINLGNAPDGLAPPDYQGISSDEYRGFLRASYRRDPRPFLDLARRAATESITIVSTDRYALAGMLWYAIVRVAETNGLSIVDQLDEAQQWVDRNGRK